MATEFTMPKLGLTMESGTIVSWLVDDGATVADGDAVVLVETDKVETEVVIGSSGVLRHAADVGETYECGARIGWILGPGEELPAGTAPASASTVASEGTAGPMAAAPASTAPATRPATSANRADDGRLLASPNARRVAGLLGIDLETVVGTGPLGRIVSEDVEAAAAARPAPTSAPTAARTAARAATGAASATAQRSAAGAPLATFAARALADDLGLDLASVARTGSDPRVTREDVIAHVRTLLAATRPSTAGSASSKDRTSPLLQTPTRVVPLRGMRGTIAARMRSSLEQMAQLTLHMDVDMSNVVADRERRRADGRPPSFTDYVIAAVARVLPDHPLVNSQITDDGVALLPEVHVAMAVALDDGLVVPVVRDTPALDIDRLSVETTRLAAAARNGTLTLDDLAGGTFSVTSLGMFGVDGFTPIVNAPNTAILGVGRLRDETRWDGDRSERVPCLTLSLTWDHRAFDGAPAAAFAGAVRDVLEACSIR